MARPLDVHPALVWALVRRHLEALAAAGLLSPDAGGTAPWVNPGLLRVLQRAHRHGPGMEWEASMAAILPPRYRDPGRVVSSAPMGAAPFLREAEGRVAWDLMWQGFCELALAGGPPHRSTLLEAVAPDKALANPERYAEVRAELVRGLRRWSPDSRSSSMGPRAGSASPAPTRKWRSGSCAPLSSRA